MGNKINGSNMIFSVMPEFLKQLSKLNKSPANLIVRLLMLWDAYSVSISVFKQILFVTIQPCISDSRSLSRTAK